MESKYSEYHPAENTEREGKGGVGGRGLGRNNFPVNKELQSLEATWYARKGTGIRIRKPAFES